MRKGADRRAALPLVMLVLCLGGCTAARPNLEGAWRLVESGRREPEVPLVKVLVDGRFAFGNQSADGALPVAGGGRYLRDGDTYVEIVEYHWLPNLVGATIPFTCRVEDGRWHHEAHFERDGARFHIVEVWQRIDDPGH